MKTTTTILVATVLTLWAVATAADPLDVVREKMTAAEAGLDGASGAAERAAVLDELVRRHEGLGAGVKEVPVSTDGRSAPRPHEGPNVQPKQ